jgi:hypothetical protein
MKLSSQLARLKRQKQTQQPPATPFRSRGGKVPLRRWALLALCLVLAAGGTWGVLRYFVWNKVSSELVGTWEVTEGPMAGGTFAFSRDGSLAIHADAQGTNYDVKARATVVGKFLVTTSQDPQSGQEQTRKNTIRELTAASLVLELEGGQVLRMVRKK